VLSGPVPLRVEYVNAVLRSDEAAPRAGDELTVARPALAGSACERMLERLFRSSAGAGECEHPALGGDAEQQARSALFALPARAGELPLVAMVGVQPAGERHARAEVAALQRDLAALRVSEERHERWLDAIAGLSAEFRMEPGARVVDAGVDVVVRQTNALDGAVATYLSGQLAFGASRRGLIGPGMVTVAGHEELARALRDAEPLWLAGPTAARFGVPDGLAASGVPIVVGGEPLGLLLMLFEEIEPHDNDNRRLVGAIAAGIGFALLRDRLAHELRGTVDT
jgi:hypothetical protein